MTKPLETRTNKKTGATEYFFRGKWVTAKTPKSATEKRDTSQDITNAKVIIPGVGEFDATAFQNVSKVRDSGKGGNDMYTLTLHAGQTLKGTGNFLINI